MNLISFDALGVPIRIDLDATRIAYGQGFGESCECAYCRNFRVVRERLFAPEIREFLEKIGIDWQKPSEVIQYCRLAPGRHLYEAMFHLFGEVPPEAGGGIVPAGTIAGAEVAFESGEFPGEEVWRRSGVIVLSLTFSEVPWELDEPEPDERG